MSSSMIVKFKDFLDKNKQDQFRFLQELVLLSSYSNNKIDVDKVGGVITHELASLPMSLETVEQVRTGNHLVFRSPACKEHEGSILLVGHMDTVFPSESEFNWYREEQGKVFGPGVIDMKGGLVVAIFALKALHHQNLLTKIPLTLICNSDEEIGSPTSRDLITKEAKRAIFGLVFECGGVNGEIVTGRKGKSGFTLNVKGRAGHAAFADSTKSSAILELAHKVISIERLNDPNRQLVVNVGTIEGGTGPNTIAENASAKIDTRYLSRLDGDECIAKIRAITDLCIIPETSATLTCTSEREAMVQSVSNQLLFQHIEQIANDLGFSVKAELRSGVSDANTMASAGLPVVDGMGPIGEFDHSDREYMNKESLLLKTLLSTVVIAQAWSSMRLGHLCFSKEQ